MDRGAGRKTMRDFVRYALVRMRRAAFALCLSAAVHVAAGVLLVGVAAIRSLPAGAIEFAVLETPPPQAIPLGAPSPAPPAAPRALPLAGKPRASRPRPAPAGATAVATLDAGAPDATPAIASEAPDAGVARDPRDQGPEGARVTALLRLDRLREAPLRDAYVATIDEVLRLLPDRRRLLDGTTLDLYRDFDALFVATPNPFDDAVTFLAARHRLDDDRLRAELERSGELAGRPVTWRLVGGRPMGLRERPAPPPGQAAPTPDRDRRIYVLPAPGLAVMAAPAYADLLLREAGGGDSTSDAGAGPWSDLVRRIGAESDVLPADAILAVTAGNLATGPAPLVRARGAPRTVSVVVRARPTFALEATAEFEREEDAVAWEQRVPGYRSSVLGNPMLLLAGLTGLVGRTEVVREGGVVTLTAIATEEESRRLLQALLGIARLRAGRR